MEKLGRIALSKVIKQVTEKSEKQATFAELGFQLAYISIALRKSNPSRDATSPELTI